MKFTIVQSNSSDAQSLESSKVQNYPEFRFCSGNIYVSRKKGAEQRSFISESELMLKYRQSHP